MHKLSFVFASPFLLAPFSLAACGGNPSPSGAPDAAPTHESGVPDVAAKHDAARPGHDAGRDAGESDADEDAPEGGGDHGSVSTTYPAFSVDLPQISKNQGTVLASPVIVTVTWPAQDPSSATWEALGDAIGASTFWSATTGEYGVGPVTSGAANHVHMTQPLPATIGYLDFQTFFQNAIAAAVAGGDGGVLDAAAPDGGVDPVWPAPTRLGGNVQTIYSVFVPASTVITDPGTNSSFCAIGALGYHDSVTVGTTPIAYSVSLECSPQSPTVEETAVHEYIEAATNPYPEGPTLGFVGFGADHLAWDIYSGFNDEVADACQNWADSYYEEGATFPYWVQRSWSNASTMAGHDPCAPVPSGTYHGMTLFPSQESSVSVNLTAIGDGPMTTKGWRAKVGETAKFQVGFYSDAEAPAWTIAYDFPPEMALFDETGNFIKNGAATVTIDKTSGQNGEKAYVSVTPTTAGALGFQIMAITWDAPTGADANLYQPHYLPIIITND